MKTAVIYARYSSDKQSEQSIEGQLYDCYNYARADRLIENGVVILLCKVGDRVYQTDGMRIYELEVLDVSIHKNMPYYETESIDFDTRAIGTSIFLTKSEAEQKLKEMRGVDK